MKIHIILDDPADFEWERWYLEKKYFSFSYGPPVVADARLNKCDCLMIVNYVGPLVGEIVSKAGRPFIVIFTKKIKLPDGFKKWILQQEKKLVYAPKSLLPYFSHQLKMEIKPLPEFFLFSENGEFPKLVKHRIGWISLDRKDPPLNGLYALSNLQYHFDFILIWTGLKDPILNRFKWSQVMQFTLYSDIEYRLIPHVYGLSIALVSPKQDTRLFHSAMCITIGNNKEAICYIEKDKLGYWEKQLRDVLSNTEKYIPQLVSRYEELYNSIRPEEEQWLEELLSLVNQT